MAVRVDPHLGRQLDSTEGLAAKDVVERSRQRRRVDADGLEDLVEAGVDREAGHLLAVDLGGLQPT